MSFDTRSVPQIIVNDNPEISDNMLFKAVYQGSKYVNATHMRFHNKPKIKKISKTQYVLLRDTENGCAGEVFNFAERESNMRFNSNMLKTFTNIRQLIRHNFESDAENQLFITLTYKRNMKDPVQLYKDFHDFWQRFKRKYKEHHLEYMTVAEPQARGAWHMHLLVKSDKPVLIAMNDRVARIWGHGFTKTFRPTCKDIGSYLVTYFTDVIYNEDGSEASLEQIMSMSEDEISKKKVKGARLPYYPPHMKFYRRSKGIVDPPEDEVTYGAIKKEFGEPAFKRQYDLMSADEKKQLMNSIVKANFEKGGEKT